MARDEDTPPMDQIDGVETAAPAEDEVIAASGAPLGERLQRVSWLVIAVVFAIFAAVNAQNVDFNWIFGGTEVVVRGGDRVSGGVPLIVLLVVAFAMGAAVSWLGTWRSRRKRLRKVRERRG